MINSHSFVYDVYTYINMLLNLKMQLNVQILYASSCHLAGVESHWKCRRLNYKAF